MHSFETPSRSRVTREGRCQLAGPTGHPQSMVLTYSQDAAILACNRIGEPEAAGWGFGYHMRAPCTLHRPLQASGVPVCISEWLLVGLVAGSLEQVLSRVLNGSSLLGTASQRCSGSVTASSLFASCCNTSVWNLFIDPASLCPSSCST